MPVKTFYLEPGGDLQTNLAEDTVTAAYRSGLGLLWVDITGVSEEEGDYMERCFGFHRLAIDDCISIDIHPPKIDEFSDYLFIIVHGINHVVDSDIVQTAELGLFLGTNIVVSTHTYPLYSINAIEETIKGDKRLMQRGADNENKREHFETVERPPQVRCNQCFPLGPSERTIPWRMPDDGGFAHDSLPEVRLGTHLAIAKEAYADFAATTPH